MASVAPQILAALAAASSPVAETRHQGEMQLQQLKANPTQYFSSCAEIFVSPQADLRGRQLVGFQLKNSLGDPACAQNTHLQTAVCEHAIVDPQRIIRNVAGSIISVAVREGLWPVDAVVRQLGTIITQRSTDLNAVHGAIRTLSYIVDDAVTLLDAAQLTRPVLLAALPYLTSTTFGTTGADAVEIRVKAFEIVGPILELAGMDFNSDTHRSLQGSVLSVVQACFDNLSAPLSQAIATLSIRCIVLSLTFYQEIDDNLFRQIGQLMYQATVSGSGGAAASADAENLRIEATEFWRAILHFPHFAELAQPTVLEIIPVLIQAIVYSDMEIGMLQASTADWQVPDKMDAIRPRHYTDHNARNSGGENAGENGGEDEDDGNDDEEVEEWNLRRVSALTLDDISQYYGDVVLLPVLQSVEAMVQAGASDWRKPEAGVVALGAFCEGCYESLTPFLPDICEMLLKLLEAPETHFLVVSTTLWTCTQLAAYYLANPPMLERLTRCILGKMENPSKMVQGSAVEALRDVLRKADEGQMDAAAPAIVNSIATCFGAYQLKNRVLLFEAVQTVCECIGEAVRNGEGLVGVLLAPLGRLWAETPNDSPLLWSLFDCMGTVSATLGAAMQPMAADMFNRAFGLLREQMQLRVAAAQAGDVLPDEEFIVTSAVLLSGLFDAMGSGMEPLLAQNEPTFTQLMLTMMSDASANVRQNGFCIASDVARTCPMHVQKVMPQFCDLAIQNVRMADESSMSVVSNVAWSLCNLLEHQVDGAGASTLQSMPAMAQLFALLVGVLSKTNITSDLRNMAENVSLCLGVMLYVDADVESKSGCSVEQFAGVFCRYVRNIRDSTSLLEASTNGFLMAVQSNPNIALNNLIVFCDLACSVAVEGVETGRMIRDLLGNASRVNSNTWRQALATCTEQTRKTLYERYGFQ